MSFRPFFSLFAGPKCTENPAMAGTCEVRRIGLVAALAIGALMAVASPAAAQAPACPNPVPAVDENACRGAGSLGWQLNAESDNIGGFATKTSFAKGENVPLKIARNQATFPATAVDVEVYRMGYYGGRSGRRITAAGATGVTVNNTMDCNAEDPQTGRMDCSNWNVTYTIPGSSLPASGVYVAKLRAVDSGIENTIVFVVRDDARVPEARVLFVVPMATYQAYNTWGVNGLGGKSVYFDRNGGNATVAGTNRAVKVSFDRPTDNPDGSRDRFFGPDLDIVYWMEQQGYDVAYTDDVAVHQNPSELRDHKIVVIGAHSEYWSAEEMGAMKAARDAGTAVVNFGSNTGYWKVRYEDGARTLVCYKTVQGAGTGASGAVSANDWGPDGVVNTADDALGLDRLAGTADDNPQNSTTTWRDNGASPGDPNAPPGGRVGPNQPENSLFGSMYFGDNDSLLHPLVIPPANANDEFSGDRLWRNSGIPENVTTTLGDDITGWEWDSIPVQAQYLPFQPSGVKQLAKTNVTAGTPSWLQDEGRQRATTPPPGMDGTVGPVKYRAASGAWVFSAGTNHWGLGMTSEPAVSQFTYNLFSDMGVQPNTPVGVTLDASGSNQPPSAGFTMSPSPARRGDTVTFDGSGSTDPGGSIARYEWDLDGDGTLETDSGANPVVTRVYPDEATLDVRLRVTDDGGATDLTVRTLEVFGNRAPTAALAVSPNPAVITQTVSLDASGSSDPDGTLVRHEWDLDGNGTFERDTGATASTSTSYDAAGTVNVAVRVTDDGGKTATKAVPLTVNSGGVSHYGDAVLDTAGLLHYWRMGETAGPTLADSVGNRAATAAGDPTFGVPGGVPADPNTAVLFDGVDDRARTTVDLTGKRTLTVEFWLNVATFENNDGLALELTDNYNNTPGGLVVIPNERGGRFAVGIGSGASRNTAFFDRPTAGQWHHYAFVLDAAAPAAGQITPYIDGRPVAYTKSASGTGLSSFASAALNFMSRAGISNFQSGRLDEVAIYGRALDAATIDEHYQSYGTNRRPVARVTGAPNPTRIGTTVTFDGSSSSDPDGSIVRYRWDLDDNGTFETDTGSTPTATRSFATEGTHRVGLRVSDNQFGADVASTTVDVGNKAPVVSLTASPNPAIDGQTVQFDASASRDLDGTIARFEWDLDGNGTFETDTGTTGTASRVYTDVGTVQVKLRATDNEGKADVGTLPVTVNAGGVSTYGDTVLDTPGLVSFWRLGESEGTTFADSFGANAATAAGGVTLGVPGGVTGDPSTAARFDGVDDSARAPLNLSGTQKATVSFWLKWNAYANDDRLAMEFTDNFNSFNGGFVVIPNAKQDSRFGVGIGRTGGRNNVYFERPSAGQWHHYAFVFDTTAPAATQITPYVDGAAVAYIKRDSGTTAGAFANSVLNLMSRGGTSLFGAGDLDEVAVFDRALSANAVAEQFSSRGTNRRPVAALSATPNPARLNQTVTFDAGATSDPDGTIREYQWDLDGNGSYETTGAAAQVTRAYSSAQTVTVKLRVIDDQGGSDTVTRAVTVGNFAPTASFTAPGTVVVGEPATFDGSASADPDGSIVRYEWDLDGNGSYETDTGSTASATKTYAAAGPVTVGLRVTDGDGDTGTASRAITVRTARYSTLVGGTSSLLHYWRLGEASGASFADSRGASAATIGSATLGVAGALAGDSDAAARFNGTNNFARATLNLSGRTTLTVEFWLKWNAFANDDDLAMEFTPNYNGTPGGFLIDPNAGGTSSRFAVGIGVGASRNTSYFARPSAGQWHHYAFVLDSTAPAANQVTPYVDGQPVTYAKGSSGTGTVFANSTLSFMSRNGASLFGAGDLDELAIYGSALSPAAIAEHFAAAAP
jgi:Concanavalin A-like lectin/glucanases superfamily/PKD domain